MWYMIIGNEEIMIWSDLIQHLCQCYIKQLLILNIDKEISFTGKKTDRGYV